jgi:predicted transcriptional regulator
MVEDFPQDVEDLLLQELESYEQLEALLLLVKEPRRSLDAKTVAEETRIPHDAAAEALDHLCERGLVILEPASGGPRFRYATPPHLDGTIRTLARIYDERRVEVAKRMTANAIERVRTAALRRFSDAFLVKRRKKDDG